MSFIGSIREILKTAGTPLSAREIHNRLKKSHPDNYGTRAQVNSVDKGRYENIEQAVLAQINSACDAAREIDAHRTAKPQKFWLKSKKARSRYARRAPVKSAVSASKNKNSNVVPQSTEKRKSSPIVITWHRCTTYEQAKRYTRAVYLHEWSGSPVYWGKVEDTFFGGRPRQFEGERRRVKYDLECKHWINGYLRHGGQLFLGTFSENGVQFIDEVETRLINQFGHESPKTKEPLVRKLKIEHTGQLPRCILDSITELKVETKL